MASANEKSSDQKAQRDDRVRAAGCVVYRRSGSNPDDIEVLVAHRPRYDDWDFPKGHVDEGETEREAAIRETLEEVCAEGEIGVELPTIHYKVKGKDKSIRWWLMHFSAGQFEPNDEVDAVVWLPLETVGERLSYENTASLLPYVRQALTDEAAAPESV